MDGITPISDLGWRMADCGSAKPPSAISGVQSQGVDRSDEQKKQIARDFESVLLTKLFDQVQESIGDSGFEEDGTSQQVHGLFWLHLAQDVADKGGFGLWQEIYAYLGQTANVRNPAELIDEEL